MTDRDVIPMQAAMQSDHDPINPPHYRSQSDGMGEVECIDAMQSALSREEFIGYLRGTLFKYNWRLGRKGALLEDARKHHWFSHKLVSTLARANRTTPPTYPDA